MSHKIVHSTDPVTLVGGGQATSADLQEIVGFAPQCVAADGGAALALAAGIDPVAVIGDFDSIPQDILARIPAERQHRVSEQATTDFEKALTRIDAPLVIGVGFTGGRVDHQLAAFHSLLAQAQQPCILLADHEIVLLAPPRITIPCVVGDVVSLFPLVPTQGASTGLEWPIGGLDFAAGTFVGTSNRATGPVTLRMERAGMLLIVSRRFIRPLAAQLTLSGRAQWPARAV